jgi:magnesium transporter
MYEIYQTIAGKLTKLEPNCISEEGIWCYMVSPTPEEIDTIVSQTGVPRDFLQDPLDVNERPRIEREEGYTLIIIRTPTLNKVKGEESEEIGYMRYITAPLGIVITEKALFTISLKPNDVLQDFREGKVRNFSTKKKNRLILQILYRTATKFLNYLQNIIHISNEIEASLHESMRNEELIGLLDVEKSLVYFSTSIRANELVLERLHRTGELTKFEEDEDFLEDLIVENRQALEMTNIHTNILSSTMDAFASVISNNLNRVMKFLTSITIILMIPTLVASIYGMNIALPFQHSPHAFAITMGISIGLSLMGVLIFIRRKWF